MTKTEWNKQSLEQEFSAAGTLGELLSLIEQKLTNQGQVVCRFHVNGLSLDEKDENKFSNMDLAEVENITVESEMPSQLLFGLLQNWIDELPMVITKADELSSAIKFEGVEGHLKDFVDLIDTAQFLIDSLISLQGVIEYSEFNSPQWLENEMLTAKAVGEALRAFESKDFVLLAEILEYDLGHALQTWQDLLGLMQTRMKEENERGTQQFSERIFRKSP